MKPGAYYFEDLGQGDRFIAGSIVVTESHIVQFAGLSGDFFPLHMDDDFARSMGFERRVAHGLLVLSLADGLKNRAQVQICAVASLGWKSDFKAPVFAGDRITVEVEIASKRYSSKGKGLTNLTFKVTKQDGVVVQFCETTLVTRLRNASAAEEKQDG